MERLQTECMKIGTENRELKAQLITMKDDWRRANNLLHSMETKMTSILEQMSKMISSPSNKRKNPDDVIVPVSNQKRSRDDPHEEIVTHENEKKRTKNEDDLIEPIKEHPTEPIEIHKEVPGDTYVHRFGKDGNIAVTDVTLADLLLLASSKGIVFKLSSKGKTTW